MMSALKATLLFTPLLIGYAGYGWLRETNADIVWWSRISDASSPNHSWEATVDENTVEGLIATGIVVYMRLLSTDYPTQVQQIPAVDTGGHHQDDPRVTWLAPDLLQITLANLSYVTFENLKPDSVRVVTRFEPDDPAARAAWLREQHVYVKTNVAP